MSSPPGTTLRVPTLPGHDFNLPRGLEGLDDLAYNLWWSWTPRAGALFAGSIRRRGLAIATRSRCWPAWTPGAGRWLSADEEFLVDASRLLDEYHRYMGNGSDSWYQQQIAADPARALPGPIAYFCAEYGFHESMQIYSGGLGVLAGDHCKSASDAALPFVGVGLLYRRGYFRQQIDADGHQEHAQPDLDPSMLPLRRARGRERRPPLQVSVDFPDRQVHAAVWVAQVGRVPVLLLDTDLPANAGPDRPITHILYVRGREMRLCQELILGIGGVRALRRAGHRAGRLAPERGALRLPAAGARARAAMAEAGACLPPTPCGSVGRDAVFTIHTPVAAGNETFDRGLVTKYLAPWLHVTGMRATGAAGARPRPHRRPERPFDMTAFVLRHASHANAVSRLHAETATETWEAVAGHPITAITNGVHVATWLGRPMRRLYERALGTFLASDHTGPSELERVSQIDDADLWAGHMQQKRELTDFIASRLAASSPATASRPTSCARSRGRSTRRR